MVWVAGKSAREATIIVKSQRAVAGRTGRETTLSEAGDSSSCSRLYCTNPLSFANSDRTIAIADSFIK